MEKIIILSIFLSASFQLFGQDQFALANVSIIENEISNPSTEIPSDCLFIDLEEHVMFIDLQLIKQNLKEVILLDDKGRNVFFNDVTKIPVDAILEIDLTSIKHGTYLLEMKSYINSMHKSIKL